jgi:hypothetical protein
VYRKRRCRRCATPVTARGHSHCRGRVVLVVSHPVGPKITPPWHSCSSLTFPMPAQLAIAGAQAGPPQLLAFGIRHCFVADRRPARGFLISCRWSVTKWRRAGALPGEAWTCGEHVGRLLVWISVCGARLAVAAKALEFENIANLSERSHEESDGPEHHFPNVPLHYFSPHSGSRWFRLATASRRLPMCGRKWGAADVLVRSTWLRSIPRNSRRTRHGTFPPPRAILLRRRHE